MCHVKTIVIADDHPLISEGLTSLIQSSTPYTVIGKVNDGKALMHMLNSKSPDLVLLDIHMPMMGGMEAAALIREKYPAIKVVVISMYFEKVIMDQLRQIDVHGFIPKLAAGGIFIDTLQKIMRGEKVYIEMKQEADGSAASDIKQLSKRQLEILRKIRDGLTTRQIAERLKLTVFTVDTHRKNICQKLNITSPNGLLKFALKNNF